VENWKDTIGCPWLHLTVDISPATLDDVGFLTDVVVEATRDQGRLPVKYDEDDFRRGFGEWTKQQLGDLTAGSMTYVVSVAGERAGRLRVVRSQDSIELAGIQLLPRFQSRGLGTAVINGLKAEAVARGVSLELGVEKDNPRARALYERLGFVLTGHTDNEFRMRWVDGFGAPQQSATTADN
jgi:ribosomal protein S18 acetylase RimI-like enzyme